MSNNTYFETLSDAVFAAAKFADDAKAVLKRSGSDLSPDELWCADIFNAGHLAYGVTRSHDFELLTLRGRPTKKFFHVVLYRLESGRYELNAYIL